MLKLRYRGGERVAKGKFWNFATGERLDVVRECALPGGADADYYRLPAAGVLLIAPFLGLLYAAFLPFIGIAMVLKIAGGRIVSGTADFASSIVSFGWRPHEAYLSGRKGGKGNGRTAGETGAEDKGTG